MSALPPATQLNLALEAALAPLLKAGGGPLAALYRFRGSESDFDHEYAQLRPCGWVGVTAKKTVPEADGGGGQIYTCAAAFEDDNLRGEAARVEGSGAPGESPGLTYLLERAQQLLQYAMFPVEGYGQTIPVEDFEWVLNPYADKREAHGVLQFTVSVPGARMLPVPTSTNHF